MNENLSIEKQFTHFHEVNPHVYSELVRMARRKKAQGHTRISIKMLFELLRDENNVDATGNTKFKFSNSYHSHYARLIMQQEPDLKDIFELRPLRRK